MSYLEEVASLQPLVTAGLLLFLLVRSTRRIYKNDPYRRGFDMKELVGTCCICGNNLYCLDGFFNGLHTDDNKTFCFDCAEDTAKESLSE